MSKKNKQQKTEENAKEKKEKTFLSKTFGVFLKTVLLGVTMIGATAAVSAINVGAELDDQTYKTDEEIYKDGELLGTDVAVATFQNYFSEFTRVKHNDGDPIYIYVPDSYNAREKEMIEAIYNYYEGVFETINPNYHFEFVNQTTMISKALQGKTVINFSKLEMKNAAGGGIKLPALANPNFTPKIQILMDSSIPETDPDFSKMTEEEVFAYNNGIAKYFEILFEEISHGMGFGDVYYKDNSRSIFELGLAPTTDNIYYNTIMANFYDRTILDLYPEDYRTLHALYNENLRNEDGSINQKSLEEALNLIDAYEKVFYSNRKQAIKNKIDDYIIDGGTMQLVDIPEEDVNGLVIEENGKQFHVFTQNRERVPEAGVQWYNFKYTLNNGVITLEIFDKNTNELLETSSANYRYIDGVIYVDKMVLKDVKVIIGWTTQFQTDGSTISSFAIGKELRTYSEEWETEPRESYKVYLMTDIGGDLKFDFDKQVEMFKNYKQVLTNIHSSAASQKTELSVKEKQTLLSEKYANKKFDAKLKLNMYNLIKTPTSNPIIAWRKEDDPLGIFEDRHI